MKFGFGKRIAGFVLAAAVAAGTFLSTPATAKAAAPLAKGIDVSKYQGAVNWSAVKNAGYSFAFIKAGSAKSGLDPYYAVNMADCSWHEGRRLHLFVCDNRRGRDDGGSVCHCSDGALFGQLSGRI